jgi:hypothetical protein
MKPVTGLVILYSDELGGLLLVGAADLADQDHLLGVGIILEHRSTSRKEVPIDRVAADAHGRRLADAARGEGVDHFVGERAERLTTPTLPFVWMWPGMMPTLASPGVISPGQLGPISRVWVLSRKARTCTMSRVGMPSVMQTTRLDASVGRLDDGVGGKARRHVDDAGVGPGGLARHRARVEDRHVPKTHSPPLPGVTPPTTLVP